MEERLLRELEITNPWWQNKEFQTQKYKRFLFGRLQTYLHSPQIVAIVGLRRVGKTTLLKQLIEYLLKTEKASQILFFPFEERYADTMVVEDILYYYLENIAKDGRKYVFLDEIQKVQGWQDILKRFYDRDKQIKFIISGSSSIEIRKSKESLAGRIFDLYLPPLQFEEFLTLYESSIALHYGEKRDLTNFPLLKKQYESVLYQKEKIEKAFLQYVYKGAFPEIVNEKNDEIIRTYINNSVIGRIISKDIPEQFPMRNKDALERMLAFICSETSQIISFEKIAEICSINKETASEYFRYLKSAFIITLLFNYSESKAKQLRKNKKVHIIHPAIAIANQFYGKEVLTTPAVMSKYIESIIAVSANAEFFWRTPQKEEVDIILKQQKQLLPIEVKYQNQITAGDTKSLLKLMEILKVDNGIIVTKELFKKEIVDKKEILFIPAWFFLILLTRSYQKG